MSHSTQCPRCGKAKKESFPLCYDCYQKNKKKPHQKVNPVTAKLQRMVKQRKDPDQKSREENKPQSIKDWINTDVNEWDKLIDKDENRNAEVEGPENTYKRKQKKLSFF